MSDRPIIFSGPMVRAILAGRKTQMRRVLKPQPIFDGSLWHLMAPGFDGGAHGIYDSDAEMLAEKNIWWRKQLHVPGDRLLVRETLCAKSNDQGLRWHSYAADGRDVFPLTEWRKERDSIPSIHMPRWASRLTLIVEDVRVQRLQEISEVDAEAEGVEPILVPPDGGGIQHVEGFRVTWDSLNAKRGYGWERNPWVVALTFRAIQKNIDEVNSDD